MPIMPQSTSKHRHPREGGDSATHRLESKSPAIRLLQARESECALQQCMPVNPWILISIAQRPWIPAFAGMTTLQFEAVGF